MSRTRVVVLFAVVALTWGGSFVAIEVGLDGLPALLFAAFRLDVAAVVALPLAFVLSERVIPRTRTALLGVAVNGVLVAALMNAFLFAGQQYTTGAVASILFSTNPVIATGFARGLLPSERLDGVEFVGLLLGLLGVGIVVRPSVAALASGTLGKLLVLVGAANLALGSVLVGRLDSELDALAETAWGLVVGAVVVHALSLLVGEPQVLPNSSTLVLAIGYVGVVATALAYPFYFELVDSVGPVRANLVSYAVPVVTAVTGWAVLGQRVGPVTVVGFGVVAAGFVLLNRTAFADLLTSRASRA
ncbi:DMT family transporter [Halobacterium wangiae]|uniref:DMT family transporter n=1 Tax=Halobacterium wangiae TaxID=2902623 RepID=UPI001E653C3B|nr:DMT family transporter [Halobacterium wangiae]